jgi:hypothetical protein
MSEEDRRFDNYGGCVISRAQFTERFDPLRGSILAER